MEAFIAHWGYLAILGGTFIEGEAVLVAAGAMAHQGLLWLPWVIVVAFVGGVLGDQAWFLIGRRYGKPYLARRPKLQERARVVQTWLDKYGTLFLIGFRFMYGLRTVTPVLLGATGFSERRFLLYNVLGAALWSTSFGAIGYGLGAGVKALLARHGHTHELLLVGVVVALVIALAVFVRMRRRERLGTDPIPAQQ
ncbi:MAG TPA: DedA family protein [Polyangiales bacterium]|nr:DedA family protein [Polyangiales bacterium]